MSRWWVLKFRLRLLLQCPRMTLDGYRCIHHRKHSGRCTGLDKNMPFDIENWNVVLRRRMQRGFEAELEDWKAGKA